MNDIPSNFCMQTFWSRYLPEEKNEFRWFQNVYTCISSRYFYLPLIIRVKAQNQKISHPSSEKDLLVFILKPVRVLSRAHRVLRARPPSRQPTLSCNLKHAECFWPTKNFSNIDWGILSCLLWEIGKVMTRLKKEQGLIKVNKAIGIHFEDLDNKHWINTTKVNYVKRWRAGGQITTLYIMAFFSHIVLESLKVVFLEAIQQTMVGFCGWIYTFWSH